VLADGASGCGWALTVQRRAHIVAPYVDGADFYRFLDRELSLRAQPAR
jgi:hypothetical protein